MLAKWRVTETGSSGKVRATSSFFFGGLWFVCWSIIGSNGRLLIDTAHRLGVLTEGAFLSGLVNR